MRLFVSYARQDGEVVGQLVADLEGLGHEVWYDQELTGGQTWWDEILRQIQSCDGFLFVASSRSASSQACRIEAEYAFALSRWIVPVRVDSVVSIRLLPPPVAERQFIDYIQRGPDTIVALVRGLQSITGGVPLPEPLPEPPPVPVTYLTTVAQLIDATQLPPDEQRNVMAELRARIADEDQRNDVVGLLRRLRTRADVLASVASDIDNLVAWAERTAAPRPAPTTAAPPAMPPPAPANPAPAFAAPPNAMAPPTPPPPQAPMQWAGQPPPPRSPVKRAGRTITIVLAVIGAIVLLLILAAIAETASCDPTVEFCP